MDLDVVRAQFPALQGQTDVLHFENAGGSYACAQVIDRLTRFYRTRKVQPYGSATPSREGGEEMDEARNRLSAMLNIAADEVSFGPSTTQNTYVLANAFRQMLAPGDAIIVTDQDHEANTGPWRRLAEAGIEVREWRVDGDSGMLDPLDLANLLDDKVRLVCFPHASNIVGVINPVADWCRIVRAAGAVSCVDGVSAAPHGFPDIDALGADIYLFSAYKTYGPHQGLMVIRRDLADALPNQGHFFNAGSREKRFTPAGPDHAQVAACAGMADYVDLLASAHGLQGLAPHQRAAGVAALQQAQETSLIAPVMTFLRDRNDIRVLGPTDSDHKVGTIAFDAGAAASQIEQGLAKRGINAGAGDFYAVRLLQAMGVSPDPGVVRLSFVHYTTRAEVDRMLDALEQALPGRK